MIERGTKWRAVKYHSTGYWEVEPDGLPADETYSITEREFTEAEARLMAAAPEMRDLLLRISEGEHTDEAAEDATELLRRLGLTDDA